jgi:hypothetical protein
MTARPSMFMPIVAALALGAVGAQAATKAQICEAAKNTAAGAKALCLQIEHAKAALGQPHNFAKCESVFMSAFAKIEQRAGGQCPTEGDAAEIEALIDACAADVATALSGGSPPPPCQQFPATGQTNSFQARDDGDREAGATLSYTDTGATIIDNNTGLEWEEKTAANVGDLFTWINAFAYIDSLNTANFAGHNDWRLPNVKELQSIVDYGRFTPSIDPIFGPTAVSNYWSSTTVASGPFGAWFVNFSLGIVATADKNNFLHVRAVRGGSP